MSLRSNERKAWKNYQALKTPESLQAWQQEYSQSLLETPETPETFRQVLNALAIFFVGIVMLLSIIIYIRWG